MAIEHLLASPNTQATKFTSENQPKNRQKKNPYLKAYNRIMKEMVPIKVPEFDEEGNIAKQSIKQVNKFEALVQKAWSMAMKGDHQMMKLLMNYGAGQRAAQLLVQTGILQQGQANETVTMFNNITVINPPANSDNFTEYDTLDRTPE